MMKNITGNTLEGVKYNIDGLFGVSFNIYTRWYA